MKMFRIFVGLLLAAVLSACGGGGGSPGTVGGGSGGGGSGGGGTGSTAGTPTVTLQLFDSTGAATSTISATQTTLARATVVDATGAPVAGAVVTFTGDSALVTFVPAGGTALTGSNGIAQVQVTPTSGSSGGAGTLKADATVAGTSAKQGTAGYQVAASAVTGTGASPAAVEIFASAPQLSSSPNSTVSFTVVVKDAQNRTLPNQTVTFTASSGDLAGALPAPVTGISGQPITGVILSPGIDRSNRNIVLTAGAGTVQQTMTMPITGTTLSLAGSNSVMLGSTMTFTVAARDSGGKPIPGAAVSASSALGNSLNPTNFVTDAAGAARFTYTASSAGVDTVTVQGLGASAVASAAISAQDFSFTAPGANGSVVVNTPQPVSVRLLSGGAPVANQAVTFSTTRGVITSSAMTNASGLATATLSSTTAGPATLVASAGTSQALLPVTFVAKTAATLVLQVTPGAVPPNVPGSTASQATLQATVRDAALNPVAGQVVTFTATQDLSNGTIGPPSAVTDANGMVSVQFTPGALSTASNGVQLQATVQGTTVHGTTSLTVSSQALFISIGKGKLLGQTTDPIYQKEFSVYVTDANGAAVPNKAVTLSIWPNTYGKGKWAVGLLPSGTAAWIRTVNATCANEDVDRSGILLPGFGNNVDVNGNGKLDPGLPTVVTPSSVTTDSGGFATFYVKYGKNFGSWLDTTITARASVAGTESVQNQQWSTEVLSADVSDTASEPPFEFSPFGKSGLCSDAN